MTARRVKRPSQALPEGEERKAGEGRDRQRAVCYQMLERWVPVAATAALALRSEGRNGAVIDEEPLEAGLKAGALVLKVLERLARLDGLDVVEKREPTLVAVADPVELARRVRVVSPVLTARLRLGSPPLPALPAGGGDGTPCRPQGDG
ncbi:MAG: hypothetical protein PHQ12_13465 [Chthoniobacteraceae bacterium]|nr:hypothetical protein [Chthoniobacteraceae bacterium]